MSKLEVNTIAPQSGTTVTLGESGDTVSLGSGVTAGTGIGTTINNNADNRIITGSGTANTLEGESNLVSDGTNLGVGETSPSTKLHVKTSDVGTLPSLQADADDVLIENSTPGITLMGATNGGGMLAFAWFVWNKNYTGKPKLNWI